MSKQQGASTEFYVYEGTDRIATLDGTGAPKELFLFDGIDHPLRITQAATSTTAYYELDLAGNVRALRASGGADLGGYRYTAFGETVEDTTTVEQPLRWKGRWHSVVAGIEVYDVRARQWAPELGVFLSVDEFEFHDPKWTLWSWPNQNPLRFLDPTGRQIAQCKPDNQPPIDKWCYFKAIAYYIGCKAAGIFTEAECIDASIGTYVACTFNPNRRNGPPPIPPSNPSN